MQEFLKKYDLDDDFTPKEKTLIQKARLSKRERAQFSWRYECYWVMLWALGYVPELGRPDHQCDVYNAVQVLLSRSSREFMKCAKLRPLAEILDKADLLYRYHWAVRQAWLEGKKAPAKLNRDVVEEWHYALNWLIGYSDQEWDDVSTDT